MDSQQAAPSSSSSSSSAALNNPQGKGAGSTRTRKTRSTVAALTAPEEVTTLPSSSNSSREMVPPTPIPQYQSPEALVNPLRSLTTEEPEEDDLEGQVSNVEYINESLRLQAALLTEQQRVAELEAQLAAQASKPIAKRRNAPVPRDDSNHPRTSLVTASQRVQQSLARTYTHPGVHTFRASIPMGSPGLPLGVTGLLTQ